MILCANLERVALLHETKNLTAVKRLSDVERRGFGKGKFNLIHKYCYARVRAPTAQFRALTPRPQLLTPSPKNYADMKNRPDQAVSNLSLLLLCVNGNLFSVFSNTLKFHNAVDECKQRVVFAD